MLPPGGVCIRFALSHNKETDEVLKPTIPLYNVIGQHAALGYSCASGSKWHLITYEERILPFLSQHLCGPRRSHLVEMRLNTTFAWNTFCRQCAGCGSCWRLRRRWWWHVLPDHSLPPVVLQSSTRPHADVISLRHRYSMCSGNYFSCIRD